MRLNGRFFRCGQDSLTRESSRSQPQSVGTEGILVYNGVDDNWCIGGVAVFDHRGTAR